MYDKIFETALGIEAPWSVKSVQFQQADRRLIILIDFAPGTRFAVPGVEGMHPVHDTVSKDYRHLNFFENQCLLRVRTPRVKLPDGGVRLIEPAFGGDMNRLPNDELTDLNTAAKHLSELFTNLERSSRNLLGRVELIKPSDWSNVRATIKYSENEELVQGLNDILKVSYEIPIELISGVRFATEPRDYVIRACEIVVDFASQLMQSKIMDIKLITAVFHDLNILGYMFDRTPKNYQVCHSQLKRLLHHLYEFKQSMTSEGLEIWNNSTFAGDVDGQRLIFCLYTSNTTEESIDIYNRCPWNSSG